MPDYQKGKIYKLVGYGLTYYGATTQPLCERKAGHKSDSKRNLKKNCKSIELFKLGNDVDIVLVESYPCNNKEELHKRERYYIENNECINKIIPTRTKKEYRTTYKHKELKKEWDKRYYEKNKEILNKKNEIRNSEKITCECGAVIRKDSLYRHIKRKSHNDNIQLIK